MEIENRRLQERIAELEKELSLLRQRDPQDRRGGAADSGDALRRAEAALTESRQTVRRQLGEIQAFYAAAPAGVAMVGPDLRFVRMNERLAEINGVAVADAVGRTVAEVVPELWPALEPVYRAVIDRKESVRQSEIRGCTKREPGVERIWMADYDPVHDADGSFLGVSLFVTEVTEARRAQRALEESAESAQRRLAEIEAVYASAPIGLCVFDEQLRFVRVNHRLAAINGIPIEGHLGKTPAEVVPDFAGQAQVAFRKVMETGEALLDFEMRGATAGQAQVRYWNNRWVPLKDERGHVVGVSVAIEEITERRRVEESLRESERLYRAIGESLDYGVWVCDLDGRCTYASDSFRRLLGMTAEQCASFGWVEALHPDDREETAAAWQESVRTGNHWYREHRFLGADGQYHAILARGVPVRDEQGRVVCWAGINLDIGALKRTEESLRESEARERARAVELEAIMDAVPVTICIARDPKAAEITTNSTGSRLLRVEHGINVSRSIPGGGPLQHVRFLRDGKELAVTDLPVQMAARTGKEIHDCELDLLFDDGELRNWIGNAVPLVASSGRPYGAVGAFVDVTERKRSEERLRHTQKLESLGLLAGGVAHDFNNLLVGIIGNASLAQDLLPPGHACAKLVEQVVQSGERAANLTRQMLAYAGKGQFLIRPLQLSKQVAEMENLIRPAISSKVSLELDLSEDLPLIEADSGQIHQVFMNLVINAAEAIGDRNGVVRVRTGALTIGNPARETDIVIGELKPGPYVFLEVRDTGCGIDPSIRSRIFEPFFSTKFTGRGLGLAAAGGAVSAHKGAVKVTSAPGAGSCLTAFFPAMGAAAEVSDSLVPLRASAAGGTILVVDDEKAIREIAILCLERRGFQVITADSGPKAIALYRERPREIAVVLLDLSMPGMGGAETLAELSKIRQDTRVIVSSGYSEGETMRLLHGQRVAAFLQKPYTAKRLVEAINDALTDTIGTAGSL